MGESWRDSAAPIIAEAIETGRSLGLEGKELRRYIGSKYPFGPREMHPYKIWLDEIKRQLTGRPLGHIQVKPLPGQGNLFEDVT